jgi:hypothetical protein
MMPAVRATASGTHAQAYTGRGQLGITPGPCTSASGACGSESPALSSQLEGNGEAPSQIPCLAP